MALKRLKRPTGQVAETSTREGDTAAKVVRRAILVHAGPDGGVLEFASGDGPIKFDAARIQNVVKVHNKMVDQLSTEYGGDDKIPDGAYPPLLDQHSDDSGDRVIGRLTGRLKFEVRDVPKVGKNVPCAVADPGLTWLGEETVARVIDGRIYHLSIGINEEDDSLGETSAVIEPAAPGAMLLASGQKPTTKGDTQMALKSKMKRLAAHTLRMTKLGAMKEELTSLSAKLTGTREQMTLTRKQGDITHRLTALMKSGKLTPAENKNLDLTKLSKLPQEALDIVMQAYESREVPVISAGQKGSSAATTFSDMGKSLEKSQQKRLRAEVASDFKRLTGKKLFKDEAGEDKDHGDTHEMGGGNKEESIKPGADEHVVPGQAGDEKQMAAKLAKHMADIGKHLEAGDIESAKKEHAAMAAHCEKYGMKHMAAEATGDVKSEDYKKNMDTLQGQVDELNTQMARMAGMVGELMDVEKDEGHELEAETEETPPAKTA